MIVWSGLKPDNASEESDNDKGREKERLLEVKDSKSCPD